MCKLAITKQRFYNTLTCIYESAPRSKFLVRTDTESELGGGALLWKTSVFHLEFQVTKVPTEGGCECFRDSFIVSSPALLPFFHTCKAKGPVSPRRSESPRKEQNPHVWPHQQPDPNPIPRLQLPGSPSQVLYQPFPPPQLSMPHTTRRWQPGGNRGGEKEKD